MIQTISAAIAQSGQISQNYLNHVVSYQLSEKICKTVSARITRNKKKRCEKSICVTANQTRHAMHHQSILVRLSTNKTNERNCQICIRIENLLEINEYELVDIVIYVTG